MALSRTLSIIKPDATQKNVVGAIIHKLEQAGLKVVAQKMVQLTRAQVEVFYGIHKARPFFNDLCSYMSSGPVVLMVLEGPDAVKTNRQIMGDTDPKKASPGTIRHDFATSIEANAVHGSDSDENAAIEIAFFFAGTEIYSQSNHN